MNNRLKELKGVTPIYTKAFDNETTNSYNTNYDILDKNNNIVISLREQSCFVSLFTLNYAANLVTKFKKGQKLVIYAIDQDTRLSESEIKEYIKHIRKLGLPFKFKVHHNYDLNREYLEKKNNKWFVQYTENWRGISDESIEKNYPNATLKKDRTDNFLDETNQILCFQNQTVYTMEIDLDKHKNLTTVKVLAYLFRYIYEWDSDLFIKACLDYKKKFPKYSLFTIMPFMMTKMYQVDKKKFGHVFLDRKSINVTLKSLKEYIKEESKKVYNNTNLSNIMKSFNGLLFRYEGPWGRDSRYSQIYLDPNQSIDDYLKFIRTTKDYTKLLGIKEEYHNSVKIEEKQITSLW